MKKEACLLFRSLCISDDIYLRVTKRLGAKVSQDKELSQSLESLKARILYLLQISTCFA